MECFNVFGIFALFYAYWFVFNGLYVGLNVKSKMHHIAILHNVFFAF